MEISTLNNKQKYLIGPVMFWTVLTTIFAWLPLVRIIGRPEGYQWAIGRLSGAGTEGPYWVFILLTLYVLTLLFSAFRGPRQLFFPMLILWHLAVTGVVIAGTVGGGSEATIQGQGLHWTLPLWLFAIPCTAFTALAIAWTIVAFRTNGVQPPKSWTHANSKKLLLSLLLLTIALALFRAGTNYNWVTAAAIITTIVHWIMLVESFKPVGAIMNKT